MDFIEHDAIGHAGGVAANGNGAGFDVNLDAFDVLGEFSELDHYSASGSLMSSPGPMLAAGSNNNNNTINNGGLLLKTASRNGSCLHHEKHAIADFSPEWAWTEVSAGLESSSLRSR
jgi:hypothetical protein